MNERLFELFKQAEKSVAFLSNSKQSKESIVQQKFAELIVRECAVVARAHTLGKYHGFVSDISEYNGIVYVEEAIKQHFGVE